MALDTSHWNCQVNPKGHLEMDGCDLISVADQYGTPIHVVSRQQLIGNCERAKAALRKTLRKVELFYSYKTNCVPGVLRLIHEQGIGAEVISPYELWVALRLGLPGERIIYNGPNKTKESLETAIQQGVKLINIDSLTDLRNTLEACRTHELVANIGVRLCPTQGWSAQFGLSLHNGEAAEGLRLIEQNRDCLEFKAIHVHLGSLITDKSLFQKTIAEIVSFLRAAGGGIGERLQYLDLGGGYGVPMVREIGGIERRLSGLMRRPFRPPDPGQCPSVEDFGNAMSETLEQHASSFPNGRPTIIVEPGRALTSNTQVLLLGVRAMKRRKTPVAILDGGKMNITFPTSFEYHHVLVANKMRERAAGRYDLVGRTCTPSDVVYHNQILADLAEGDVIAIMDAGAYFTSFSNDFAFPRPPVVLAHDGATTILRQREAFEGMVARDVFD